MSAHYRTSKQWKAAYQSIDRQNFRRAGIPLEEAKNKRAPFASAFTPFVATGAGMAPVKVYGPDGALREVVSAAEWRKRHGDPFKDRVKEADDGEA